MSDSKLTVRLVSICMQMGLYGGKPQAFMLVGAPGEAKTEGITHIARAIEQKLGKPYPAEVWSGPQISAEDVSGLPVPDLESNTTRLLPLRVGDKVIPHNRGVLCIDEFGSISPSQEAAFLNLIQGGRLGERTLPHTIALGAMMNPEEYASNGRSLSAPAANRFAWFDWSLDLNSWLDYQRGGAGLEASIVLLNPLWEQQYRARATGLITAYLKANPQAFRGMPAAHDASRAWASPRSWENAIRMLAATLSTGVRETDNLAIEAVSACIGPTSAQMFGNWLVDMAMPDPEDILKHPEQFRKLLPSRPDQRTVTLDALAYAALAVQTKVETNDKGETVETELPEKREARLDIAWDLCGEFFTEYNDIALSSLVILMRGDGNATKRNKSKKWINHVIPALQNSGMMIKR